MSSQTSTLKFKPNQSDLIRSTLSGFGYREERAGNEHQLWFLKHADFGSVIAYKSGKLVVQGADTDATVSVISAIVDSGNSIGVGGNPKQSFTAHIGVDEVGKGDYFGPMVAVAAFVRESDLPLLKGLKVGDSKKIRDDRIVEIHNEVVDRILHCSYILEPREYNEMIAKYKNVAIVLAKMHSAVIEGLLKELDEKGIECGEIVVDQFSANKSRSLNELGPLAKRRKFTQFHKGESDIAVATASVMARAYFVGAWSEMENEYGMKFPKGASNVIGTGKQFVRKHGAQTLSQVAKVSFKTTKQVLA